MGRQRTGDKRFFMAKIMLVLCVFGVILWGYCLPQDVTIYTHDSFDVLEDDWTQLVYEEAVALESWQHFLVPEVGVPIVLVRTITEDMAGQCVLFYAEHQEVFVSIDGQVVESLTCPKAGAIFATPGRAWVSVPIVEEMVGQTLNLSFQSDVVFYHGVPSEIYCVSETAIYAVQVDFLLVRNTVALLMLVLAVVSYVNAVLWKQRRMKRFLFSLADLYLFVGLWLCAEVNVLAIWFGRGTVSAVLAMVFSRIIPVAFYQFFMTILPYTSWRTRFAGWLVWGNLLASLLLQFVCGISLLRLVPVNIGVIAICCVLGLVEIGYYHGSGLQFLTYGHACYLTILLFLASLIECYFYVHYQAYGQWMGVVLCLCCVAYYIITHMFLVGTQSATAEEKQRLEKTFCNLHKHTLNQQINAHFLYNSLNTISAYCQEDAQLADEAIRLLGQYMRAYTKLLGADDYVPLEEELDLMRTYMVIQNMRFEHSIHFAVHNTCDDVRLPPLTLQPLVENAVNHGIRKRKGKGEISITTRYRYNMAEIIISDDGAGFDVKTLKTTKGVGLGNLESRIKAMGGRLRVQSTKGKGTQVTLMVPMDDMAMEDEEIDCFICG